MSKINTSLPYSGFIDSRQGGRPENQDSCGFVDTARGLLVVVCDGMGGGPGGRTASSLAVETIIREIQKAGQAEHSGQVIKQAIKTANRLIYKKGLDTASLRGMGSTAVVLLINKQSAIIAHVGDSRGYQLRRGSKVFRTFDHSMVFDMVRQKVLTEEQARLSAQSNLITRALGVKPEVEVEITERAYEKGDRFLLCTDGLWGAMPEKEFIKTIGKMASPEQLLDTMMITVDEYGFRNGGGHDNLTGVLIETMSNSTRKEKMSTRIRNIVIGLVIVCIGSIAGNIIQYSGPFTRIGQDVMDSLNVQKAGIDQLRQENADLKAANQQILKSINEFLSKQDIRAAQKIIKEENDKQEIIDKLDVIICRLEELGNMQSGKKKNKEIDQLISEIEEIIPPLEKYNIGKDEFSDSNKGIIGYLKQKMAKGEGDETLGHYKKIIEEIQSIKEIVNSSN
ncbi:protein phosphatase 2C domain-containing protein [uncultured Parabacteroides sp.]|uniref:protein phosphatase 2C domain-containing protein n=1 Tax=uncultured Parabacteroides sp. TaxID=512312 RepID=UPI0025ED90FA|nr:protein phosphatase 2C domain-containing protein [uncultured Parabacteroides sp.]